MIIKYICKFICCHSNIEMSEIKSDSIQQDGKKETIHYCDNCKEYHNMKSGFVKFRSPGLMPRLVCLKLVQLEIPEVEEKELTCKKCKLTQGIDNFYTQKGPIKLLQKVCKTCNDQKPKREKKLLGFNKLDADKQKEILTLLADRKNKVAFIAREVKIPYGSLNHWLVNGLIPIATNSNEIIKPKDV
jgi:hypothetical protein